MPKKVQYEYCGDTVFSISTRFSPVSASSGSIHHKRYMSVHTEFGKGSTTGSKAMNRLAAVQILRRSNQRKGVSKQPIFLSAPLSPFPRISACGSRCGSGGCPAFCPTPESAFLQQKSTENRSFRCFLELLGGFEPPTSSLPRMRSTY